MNKVSVVTAAHSTSTSGCEDEKGARSLKVRACMRTLSPPNDSAMCSLACQRGCLWLTGYPTLVVTFLTTCRAPLAHLNAVLPDAV